MDKIMGEVRKMGSFYMTSMNDGKTPFVRGESQSYIYITIRTLG